MAIIAVTQTDPGDETNHWQVPQDNLLIDSPIPRGLRLYRGAVAVAALGAGDETNVDITHSFPAAFIYQPKSISISFLSDDLTTEFSNLGGLEFRVNVPAPTVIHTYAMECPGAFFRLAVRSVQTFHPVGTWRRWINGPAGDAVHMLLADISGDASTAGDIQWSCEYWEYDIEQCFKWPVNTPQPVVSY